MDGSTETQQHLTVDGVRVYATLEGGLYQGIELIDPLTVSSPANRLL